MPESPPDALLDTLIDESLSRWGGRRTPIVPTDGKSIAPAYWSFLDLWDADIIYSYVPLSEEIANRIVCLFAPSEVRLYKGEMPHDDGGTLRPDYASTFEFLSSLSVLPLFAKWSQIRGDRLPEIIDKEIGTAIDRDLADSFGFVSDTNYFGSLLPHARRVSLACESGSQGGHPAQERVSYVHDAERLINMIGERRDLLTLGRLSDMFCPYLRPLTRGREGWDDHMSIIIGDSIADRLLFWNAQHRYSSLGGMDDIPVLRLSPRRLENGIAPWLKNWVARRNHRHLNGNGAPQTVLRSCSLTKEQLDAIGRDLSDRCMVMISSEHHVDPCVFDGCDKYLSANREGLMPEFPSTWAHPLEARGSSVRFENNFLDLPLIPPWHIKEVTGSGLTNSVWAVDLRIERAEDHNPFSNRHDIWKWPRRLRLEQAIDYVSGHPSLVLPPRIRPTECGDLTVWDCASWNRPTLQLPRDYQAFALAVERFVPGAVEERKAIEANGPRARFEVTVSDKGRDLLGVFQFFQSLPEALAFLTDDFWCDVISRLSPEEPANNKKSIDDLAQKIRESIRQEGEEVLDPERLAKRALALAVRSLASQREQSRQATFDTLLTWAKQAKRQNIGGGTEEHLTESVTYLRDRGFLWQGYGWRCSFCQHHNWVPLDRLSPIVNCEICRKPESSPVSGGLHFRLNPFVQHAFSSTSAQGSVIWCIERLARRVTWSLGSFAFVPTLDLYRPGQDRRDTDIDLLAVVDGQVYLVEVKSSFAGVEPGVFEQLKRLAQELKPDVVMLAVMDSDKNGQRTAEIAKEFETRVDVPDVRRELLTLAKPTTAGLHFPLGRPMDKKMKWSAW